MNRLFTLAVACACFTVLTHGASAAGNPLLIENVTLLSPEQAQPLGNRHVLIRDGRIAAVSDRPSRRRRRAPPGWRRQIPDARADGCACARVRRDRPAVRLARSRDSGAGEGLLRAAAAQLPLLRRDAGARHRQPPRACRGVRGAAAAPGHLPLRRGAGRRWLSTRVHRQGHSPQDIQRLHFRTRECARTSAAGGRQSGRAHAGSGRGSHRRERRDLREDRAGRWLRRSQRLAAS